MNNESMNKGAVNNGAMNNEQVYLAALAGLLHDVGKFAW